MMTLYTDVKQQVVFVGERLSQVQCSAVCESQLGGNY